MTTGKDVTPVRPTPTAISRPTASTGSRHLVSADMPAADTRTSLRTRVGKASVSSAPMKPPIELPTTTASSIPSRSHNASMTRAKPWIEIRPEGISEAPKPGRSGAITRKRSMK